MVHSAADAVHAAVLDAWTKDVAHDVQAGRVFSESELQAVLYGALRRRLDRHADLRVMLEPRGARRVPDVVVTFVGATGTSHDALAVIELKIDRHSRVRFEGEFSRLIERREPCELALRGIRPDGTAAVETIRMNHETRIYLGFVGRCDCAALYAETMMAREAGRALARDASEVARRTTLLYGRLFNDAATEFGSEPLHVEAGTVIA